MNLKLNTTGSSAGAARSPSFDTVNEAALAAYPTLLQMWFPLGRLQGQEFVVGNLQGDAGESMSVNINTGVWKDFADGHGGSDAISLFAAIYGLKQSDAKRRLAEELGLASGHDDRSAKFTPAIGPKAKANRYAHAAGATKSQTPPPHRHPTLGEPSLTHEYTTADGEVIFYHCRFDRPGKPKEFRPLSWCDGQWQWKDPKGLLPLYGLPDLAAHPDKPVLLVEGEKTTEIAREIIPDYLVITWPHGRKAINKIDWSPLEGREVTCWPDADTDGGGVNAMEMAAKKITAAGAMAVAVVNLPECLPKKWDLGDPLPEGWTTDTVLELIEAAQPMLADCDPTGLKATPFSGLDVANLPRRNWLYARHYVRKHISMTAAWGGSGKTMLLLIEAVAIASGKAILGIKPEKRCRVWHINFEEPREELERRLAAIMTFFNVDQDLLKGWLWYDGRECKAIIATEGPQGVQIAEPVVEQLQAEIRENRIDVLQLDPFVKAHRVHENDNTKMDEVCTVLGDIADRTNIAIEVAHHVRKSGGNGVTVEDLRGAGSIVGAARSVRMMASMSEREASSLGIEQHLRRWYTRVDAGAKANMRPPAEEAEWLQFENYQLANGDSVGVLKPFAPEKAFDGLDTATIHDLLARVAEASETNDPYRSDIRSNRWVGSLVQKMFGKSENLAKQVVKTWLENGLLESFEFVDASRQKRKTGVRSGPERPGNIHDFNT